MQLSQSPTRFLRRTEVLLRTGLGKSTLYRLMRAGQFPKSFLLTPRCAVWNESDISFWMSQRSGTGANPAPLPPGKNTSAGWVKHEHA